MTLVHKLGSAAAMLAALACFTVPASSAFAQSASAPARAASSGSGGEGWTPPQVERDPSVSREEVEADLMLWRRAGMPALVQGEAGPDLNSAEYRKGLATYHALRQARTYAGGAREEDATPIAANPAAARPF